MRARAPGVKVTALPSISRLKLFRHSRNADRETDSYLFFDRVRPGRRFILDLIRQLFHDPLPGANILYGDPPEHPINKFQI